MLKPINTGFNIAVNHIASRLFPLGYDVSDKAPQGLADLTIHYNETRRILVWNGASDKTIFACPETNYAFRAWHDSKHLFGQYPFEVAGEYKACADQLADVMALYNGQTAKDYCAIVRAEIIGQTLYCEKFGGFPIEQRGFVKQYLVCENTALQYPTFGIGKVA